MCFKKKEKPEYYWKKASKNDLFNYSRVLKPICGLLTSHRHRKLIGWDDSFSTGGHRYPNRHDFYYKCKICGWTFFNHKPRKEDLQYIKKFDAEKRLEELSKPIDKED